MSLLLAPYNDSMRLGMGFNSYTQTMCIDGAVVVKNDNKVKIENPSQVVTYSSKFVERLSDIVSSMNISYSAAIKKGTIEVSGNGNSIDEDKIKASDINLVVSVQVINQTTCLKDSAEFKELDGVMPGSPAFNDAFGDCYISGFIEGGDFSSIISMRCLDRSKKNSVIRSIKRMAKTTEAAGEFSMDSYSLSDNLSGSSAMKDTETTVSVNWMGGGQIKDPKTTWDITSVYEAAASFPAYVAKTPQKTWAILTKYKANRSFNKWATALSLRPLEYDAVISYTAELFNNFMEYKQLVKKVQDIISHGDQYAVVLKPKAIPVHIGTLVAVRSALRNEMNKIVSVVNVLSRRPELLSQADSFNIISKNALVRQIVDEAISASPDSKVIYDDTPTPAPAAEAAANATPAPAETSAPATAETTSDFQEIEHSDAAHTPATEKDDQLATPKPAPQPAPQPQTPQKSEPAKIDLSALIAPEVWADLLPVRTGRELADQEDTGARAAAATLFPPPPKDDAVQFLSSDSIKKLKIHAAVCGIHDVTQTLQDRVKEDTMLTIPINEIDHMATGIAYENLPQPFVKTLALVYQFGDGPLRVCTAKYDKDSTESIQITSSSQHTEVKPRPWTKESWSLVTAVYGGKIFHEEGALKSLEDQISTDFNGSIYGSRRARLSNDTMGSDPLPNVVKTGVVFFKSSDNSPVRATVAVEGRDCSLSDQPQIAELYKEVVKEVVKEVEVIKEVTREVIKEVPHEVIKEVVREVPAAGGNQISLFRGLQSERHSCTFEGGRFSVDPSEEPFLRFDNGVHFKYQPDGNFVVYWGNGGCAWACDKYGNNAGRNLRFQEDGNLVTYGDSGAMWNTNTWDNPGARLVLSSTKPFIEVFRSDGGRIFNSW